MATMEMKKARELDALLDTYGNFTMMEKIQIVSGLLLLKKFDPDFAFQDAQEDGRRIYKILKKYTNRFMTDQLRIFLDGKEVFALNEELGTSPMHTFRSFLEKLEDLCVFYNDFIYVETEAYPQGSIATIPEPILAFVFRMANITPEDIVMDPFCRTGRFLAGSKVFQPKKIWGLAPNNDMCGIAMCNLFLAGEDDPQVQTMDIYRYDGKGEQPTVAFVRPPYGQGRVNNPAHYEIAYVERILQMMAPGGRVFALIPQPSLTLKTPKERAYKDKIFDNHTLEGVISFRENDFFGDVNLCLAVFTAKIHTNEMNPKLLEYNGENIYKQWCAAERTHIEKQQDWLYHTHLEKLDEPKEDDFVEAVKNYVHFEFTSLLYERDYLIQNHPKVPEKEIESWDTVSLGEIFEFQVVRNLRSPYKAGIYPLVSSTTMSNGHMSYVDQQSASGNCLAVETSVKGYVTYQPYDFVANSHISKLTPKFFGMNLYRGLFLSVCINRVNFAKYSKTYKAKAQRLKNQQVLLPVTSNGKLDLAAMDYKISKIFEEVTDKLVADYKKILELKNN